MSDIWQAQNAFWNQFSIPAYDEQTKSEDVGFPHLTYESFSGLMGQQTTLAIHLWYRDESWGPIKQKADEIKTFLAYGRLIPYDKGSLWIKMPETTVFAQPFATGSDDGLLKRIMLTVEAEALERMPISTSTLTII